DGARYGLKLLGGDTVSTPGPMTAGVTALGYAPAGRAVRRAGARAGDDLFVTGTIGDGWLGLQAAQGGLAELEEGLRSALAARYRLPEPRLEFTSLLRARASAAMDISDGLVADLGHLCRASGVGAELDLERLPLSAGARAWLALQPHAGPALAALATGGDDYELLIAAGASDEQASQGAPLTRVGRIVEGEGVQVRHHGSELRVGRGGWRHR
ncbi:MAG: AIR synthase-related protein, partial [Pseudomonadota bacterium]|nr:AIR synthase-related protein [Pseudomonadota bacterium]